MNQDFGRDAGAVWQWVGRADPGVCVCVRARVCVCLLHWNFKRASKSRTVLPRLHSSAHGGKAWGFVVWFLSVFLYCFVNSSFRTPSHTHPGSRGRLWQPESDGDAAPQETSIPQGVLKVMLDLLKSKSWPRASHFYADICFQGRKLIFEIIHNLCRCCNPWFPPAKTY